MDIAETSDPDTKHGMCTGTEFQTRIQGDGRPLHQCTTCERVSRTQRLHQEPGPTTRSHDKTMAILFDHAKPVCIDCNGANVSGPDDEGFYNCHECGAAWIPGVAKKEEVS